MIRDLNTKAGCRSQGTKEAGEGKLPEGAGNHRDSGYVIRRRDKVDLSLFPSHNKYPQLVKLGIKATTPGRS